MLECVCVGDGGRAYICVVYVLVDKMVVVVWMCVFVWIIGGSCHKYHFCHDKHFVTTNILSRQTRLP